MVPAPVAADVRVMPVAQGEQERLAGIHSPRLSVYAAMLLAAIGVVQLVASLLFYRSIDEHTLREDHARRVAEMLVVSDRVFRLEDGLTAKIMTSRHLEVTLAPVATVGRAQMNDDLERIGRQIVSWEPSLADRPLHLAIQPADGGRRDLVGSMQLGDGVWLNFRSRDISSMWPIALRATWMTLVTAFACLCVGLVAIRLLTQPLRRLSEAAREIGQGRHIAIRESGPTDLRNLGRAMNEMQQRIARLLEDQARSFEAISHDLRTPLARQKIATEMVRDAEVRDILDHSVDEMEAMLQSLQRFLRAQHMSTEPGPVDLDALLRGLLAPLGDRVRLAPLAPADVETYYEPLRVALEALFENALQFGETIEVTVEQVGRDWFIEIKDDGPGIPAEHFEDVLAPFFRLDEARGRTTKGFGLGIPTAHRLLTRFGGKLSFFTASEGGLIVRVQVPRPV